MSARKPGSLVVAPSSKPGNGTLWRDIHSVDGPFSPAYVGEAIESDAILFAASPELVAALESIAEDLEFFAEEVPPSRNECGVMAKKARAALAKVEGAK